jgi:hypothetical protein
VGDVPAISSATCRPPRHRTRIRAARGGPQPTGTAVHIADLRAYGHPLTATLRDSLATFTSTCRDRPDRGRQVSQMPTRIALVVPDALATTIKLTSPASRRCPLAWRQRTTASGRCRDLYMGSAIMTGLEIHWPRVSGLADRLPSLQPARGWAVGYGM